MDVTVEQRPELPLSERKLLDAALSHPLCFSLFLAERSMQTPESIFFVKKILRTRNITKINKTRRSKIVSLVLSVQTNLQRGSGPVVLLHKGDNDGVNPEDVRLEHLHQALYRLLPLRQVRDHPGGVRCHWRRGS